ncbi:pathogenicity island protein, partial [Staphylococcus aureus]|nr:pathogenicity island protein [Staphylococcus aureus]
MEQEQRELLAYIQHEAPLKMSDPSETYTHTQKEAGK